VEAILSKLAAAALLAADAAPAGGGQGDSSGMEAFFHSPLPILIALVLVFYFIVMRPQSREQARRKTMLAAVKKNDRVLTAGGIYGVVTNVRHEADEVTVKVDETTNTKLRMTIGSIARVLGDEPSGETPEK